MILPIFHFDRGMNGRICHINFVNCGTDYAIQTTTCPPGFSDLPTAQRCMHSVHTYMYVAVRFGTQLIVAVALTLRMCILRDGQT